MRAQRQTEELFRQLVMLGVRLIRMQGDAAPAHILGERAVDRRIRHTRTPARADQGLHAHPQDGIGQRHTLHGADRASDQRGRHHGHRESPTRARPASTGQERRGKNAGVRFLYSANSAPRERSM